MLGGVIEDALRVVALRRLDFGAVDHQGGVGGGVGGSIGAGGGATDVAAAPAHLADVAVGSVPAQRLVGTVGSARYDRVNRIPS